MLIHGEPRLTRDIDVTLGVDVSNLDDIRKIVSALSLETPVEVSESFVRETMVLPVFEKKSGVRVDFIFSNSIYERQAIPRAKPIRVANTAVLFASPEDLIIHKMVAGRPRDIEDVRSVLIKNSKLKVAYIRKWLVEFDTALGGDRTKLFVKLLQDAK